MTVLTLLLLVKNSYFLAFFVGLTAVLGDILEGKLDTAWGTALVDNLTHALVACFSWLSVAAAKTSTLRSGVTKEAILCGLLASLVDVDHFISAASWRLSDATHLKGRPFLHNTSLILLVGATALTAATAFSVSSLWTLGWVFLTAAISHHIRDATRRGFWFWFFGSTQPTPYYAYIAMQVMFPLFLIRLKGLFSAPVEEYSHPIDIV